MSYIIVPLRRHRDAVTCERIYEEEAERLGFIPSPVAGFLEAGKRMRMYVAVDTTNKLEPQVIGFVRFGCTKKQLTINLLAVDSRHRRRKIGSSLIGRAMITGFHAGCSQVSLHCRHNIEPATTFWNAIGFNAENYRQKATKRKSPTIHYTKPFPANFGESR